MTQPSKTEVDTRDSWVHQHAADAITAIETWRWRSQPNCLWVEVTTRAGVVGLGETFYGPGAVESIIHDMAAPLLLGEDSGAITQHWRNLFACANFAGFAGAEMRAFSALDMALWDILGKTLQRPIHALLGGAVRESIPIYNTCVDTESYTDQTDFLDRPAELAEDLLDHGITGMKIWPWDRFAPQIRGRPDTGPAGWSAMGPPGYRLPVSDLAAGIAVIEAIRERVGDRMDIMLEGHSRWDVNSALKIARAVEPYGIAWMEDFLQPDSVADLRRLVEESRIPQAVSERLISRYPFRAVLEAAAAHVVMLDVAWVGGISEASRVADLAEAFHLPVAPHDCTGPATLFANLQLAAAKPNAMIVETVRGFYEGYYRTVLDEALPIERGMVRIPQRPGIGAALDEGFKRRHDVSHRGSSQ